MHFQPTPALEGSGNSVAEWAERLSKPEDHNVCCETVSPGNDYPCKTQTVIIAQKRENC